MKYNSAYAKSLKLCRAQAALNTEYAMYNLDMAASYPDGWERRAHLANAIMFQNKAASYAKDARHLMGLE